MKYPEKAKELVALLQTDQAEWKAFARKEFYTYDKTVLQDERKALKQRVNQRAERALEIIDEIGKPTITNIGVDAAQAISILVLHDTKQNLTNVLDAFNKCYEENRDDTFYQAIPSMTDWLAILERQPQRFGTIWFGVDKKAPYLPTVEDFEHVNERREKYGIEPLHWPKSLAIPESEQPWLKRPFSEFVMRDPTDEEYEETLRYSLNNG